MRKMIILLLAAGLSFSACSDDDTKTDNSPPAYTSPEIATSTVIFRLYGNSGDTIYLAGSFNDYSASASEYQLTNTGNNIFSLVVTKTIATNNSVYKFVSNGFWIQDPKNSNQVDDGLGGYNSKLVY